MPERPELPDDAFAATELVAGASLVEQDIIIKANAGAMLTFAVWSLPKDTVSALFKDAPTAFHKAYGAACAAYGVGGPELRFRGTVVSKEFAEKQVGDATEHLKKMGLL